MKSREEEKATSPRNLNVASADLPNVRYKVTCMVYNSSKSDSTRGPSVSACYDRARTASHAQHVSRHGSGTLKGRDLRHRPDRPGVLGPNRA